MNLQQICLLVILNMKTIRSLSRPMDRFFRALLVEIEPWFFFQHFYSMNPILLIKRFSTVGFRLMS